MNINQVLSVLESHGCKPRRSGSGWAAFCPLHEADGRKHNPSYSINEGREGRVLIECMAGCPKPDTLERIGLKMTDLFPDSPQRVNGNRKQPDPIAFYEYHDETDNLLYRVNRFPGKKFSAWKPDANGGWKRNIEGVRRVLYGLPKVIATVKDGGTIFICEGEKDCNSVNAVLEDGNFFATCNPFGAGKGKWRPEFSEILRGTPVVIVADKDKKGRDHARRIAGSLEGIAASVKIVEAKAGNDAHDHLAAGHGLADLVPAELEPEEEKPAVPETAAYPCTDAGNGEMFASMHGDQVRFDHRRSRYLLWTGNHWQPDREAEIRQLGKAVARKRYADAATIEDLDERKVKAKWGHLRIEAEDRGDALVRPGRETDFRSRRWMGSRPESARLPERRGQPRNRRTPTRPSRGSDHHDDGDTV